MISPSKGCVLWAVSLLRYSLHTSNMSSAGFTPQICQPSSHHTVARVTKLPEPCGIKSLPWKATVWPHIIQFVVSNQKKKKNHRKSSVQGLDLYHMDEDEVSSTSQIHPDAQF